MKNYGSVEFSSTVPALNEGFEWAKKTALSYAHDGEDPAGLWYEAALPGREAFCMRDTAHHAAGAAALGLQKHTKNMLYLFAKSISREKNWCGYWEITKDGLPCPDDYISDEDFWYNFPGSFEVIYACWREYLRTGDSDYIEDPVFNYFYERTCTDFVREWDKDGDGILEHYPEYGRRGLASYNEGDTAILTAGDMLASQWAAYGAYGNILLRQGKEKQAQSFWEKQGLLKTKYLKEWFDQEKGEFYGAITPDGQFYQGYYKEGNVLPIYFGLLNGEEKMGRAYEQILKNPPDNVEGKSYMPQVMYTCGDEKKGLEELISLGDPKLERREYPEVSFAYIGTVTEYVMGISVKEGEVSTRSGLPEGETAAITGLPLFEGSVCVEHNGKDESRLTNKTGRSLQWKAVFSGSCRKLSRNGKSIDFETGTDQAGNQISFAIISLENGQTECIRAER